MEAETEATSTHTSAHKSTRNEVVEVVTRGERRRMWSDEQKRLVVLEAMQPGARVTEVARRWGVGTGLIYTWRRQMQQGELGTMPVPAFAELTVTPPPAMAERVKIFRRMTDSGVQAAVSVARIRSAVFWRGLCSGVGRSDWVVRSPA
jgi:transposase-like protein